MEKDSTWFLYCEELLPIQRRATWQTYGHLSIMAACPVAVGEATNLRCSPTLEHINPVTEQELRRALVDETFSPVTDPERIEHYATMLASLVRSRGNRYEDKLSTAKLPFVLLYDTDKPNAINVAAVKPRSTLAFRFTLTGLPGIFQCYCRGRSSSVESKWVDEGLMCYNDGIKVNHSFFAACLGRSCATYLLSSPAITFLQTHREQQPAVDEDKLSTTKLPFVLLYDTDKPNAINVAAVKPRSTLAFRFTLTDEPRRVDCRKVGASFKMTGLGRRLNCAIWHSEDGEDAPNDSHDPEPPSKRAKLEEVPSLSPVPTAPITKVYDEVKIDHTGVTYRRVFQNPAETPPSDVFERRLTLSAALFPKGIARSLAPPTSDACAVFPTAAATEASPASSVDTGSVSISPCNSAPAQARSDCFRAGLSVAVEQ